MRGKTAPASDLLVLPRVSLDALQLDSRNVHACDLAHLEQNRQLVLGRGGIEGLAFENEPAHKSGKIREFD